MADKKFTLAFDAQMDVSQMKQALNQIQNSLNGLKISDNVSKSLTQTFNKLSEEIKQFEVLTSKGIDSKGAFNKLERTTENIGLLFEKLKLQIKDISSLSGESLKKLFPASVVQSINNANNALKQYNATIDQNLKKINEQNNLIQKQQDKLATRQANREATQIQLEQAQAAKTAAEALKQQALVRIQNRTHIQDEAEALKELNRLEEEATTKLNRSSSDQMKARHEGTIRNVQALRSAYEGADAAIKQADADIVSYTKSLKTQDTTITKTKNYIAELTTTLERLKSEQITGDENALNKLFEDLSKLDGIDLSKYEHSVEGAEQALNDFTRAAGIDIVNATKQVQPALEGAGRTFADTTRKVDQANQAMREFDQRAKEIEGIKQRIQYFFGLNNAIQLARRAVRSAFTTIKELDKAMTETAVVTDFTIGDMWSQLPEYTKRANELGVTTLAAYEASTLFYQQGLKTNEVVALSNETLKMARIAGLDAAEATDRMTNALRGFNMELTETNAQRVDDVYSKLAAITASNVDEISTAMTKVASLAHNANMEFETTAAFLAQIIETTRESAETAGTALKTVIARFSEVKELYTKDELMGTDEEGEEINVNKIAKALKTAGIDLNQYFLGNVGLDTIFMELAEKWSSLTNIQQRYIATQAAGSRQQSRFIALMSDYARTQDLVGAAYNANGAAATQFEKTQDSLQSKLARLKNAWDEFTMSLTNSTLVKGAVDLLTTILNIVNKLTSGFGALTGSVGGFINALLKVGAVLGARSLARGPAAVLLNSLGGLLGKGGVSGKQAYATAVFGNQSNIPANATWGTILRQQFGGSWKNLLQQRKAFLSSSIRFDDLKQAVLDDSYTPTVPKTMFGAIGNRWINKGGVGAKLSTLLGGASGAVTLGVALAGVTAAATAAYGIIKMLYDASPAGQLKAAKQFKEEIDYTRESLQATQKTLQSTLETYESQVETLKLATYGTQEWANAFSEVNNTVTDLITKFPQLVEYVTTTSDGLMQLDEKGLEAYQESIANQLKNYNALSILATGGVAQKTAATLTGSEAAAQKYIATASYQTAINSLFSDDQFSQAAKKAFAQNFDFTEWAKEAGKSVGSGTGTFLGLWGSAPWQSKASLREEYQTLTGQEADEGWSKNQIADAIGQFKNLNIISDKLTEISNILIDWEKNSNIPDQVSKLLTGDVSVDISNFTDEQIRSIGVYAGIYNATGGNENRITNEVKSSLEGFFEDYVTTNNLNKEELLTVLGASDALEGASKLIELIATVQANQQRFLEDTNKIFSSTFTDDDLEQYLKEFTDSINGFSGSIDPKDFQAIGEKFKQLALTGGKTTTEIEEFFNKFNIDAIKNDTEKLKTFYSAIASTDFSNPKEIEQLFIVLDDLGITFSGFGSNVEDAAQAAIDFANALKQTDLAQARTKAGETGAFVTDILQNERFEFTEDEFKDYLTEFADDFMQLGDSFVYVGDSITKITDQILINTQNELEQARKAAEAEIKQDIQSEADWNELQKLRETYTNEQIAQLLYLESQGKGPSRATSFSSDFTFTGRTDLSQQGFLDLINNISTFWTTRDETEKQLNELYEYFKYTQSYKNLSTKSEEDTKILSAKVRTDDDAQKYYQTILRELQKEDKINDEITLDLKEQEAIAAKLSLAYAENIKELNKIGQAVSDNLDKWNSDDIIQQTEAIENIGIAFAQVYGLGLDEAETFVKENKDLIQEAASDSEHYTEFLDRLSQAWIQSYITENKLLQDEAQTLITNFDLLKNAINEIPDKTIIVDADISQLAAALNLTEENFEKLMNSMGYTMVTDVVGSRTVTMKDIPGVNETFAAQAAAMGFELPPIEIPIVKTYWKRDNVADLNWGGLGGGGTKSSGSAAKTAEPTTSTWTADPDWLYNLNKAIKDLSDTIDDLNRDLTRALEDPNSSGNEILSIVGQLLESYYKKADLLQYEQEKYNYKVQQLLERYSNVIDFVYDSDTGEINLDTDALKDLSALDEETYNDAMELFSGLDELDEGRKQILNELNSIEDSVRSLLDYQREAYLNLESRVIEALINERQRVIDNYSELSDTLTSTNQDILNSLQEEISLQRQIRDNTKTEEDINAKEARLAYLRRDTTGRNELDIKKLEKELEQSRENYADSLVDQAISALQQTNAKDTEQREHQIEIMQAQLDYDKEVGAFNNEAISIITNSIDGNGKLISDSRLVDLLKTNDNWDALTAQQQKDWADDLNKNTNAAAAFLTGSDANSLSNLLEDVLGVDNPIYKWLTGDGNQSLNDMIQSIIDGINNKTIETSPEVSEENRTQQIGAQSLPAEKVVQTDAEGNKTDVTPGATGGTAEDGGNQIKGKDELRTYLTEAYNGIVKQQLMGDDRKNWVRNTYGSIFADKIEEFVKSVQEIFNNIYLKKLSVQGAIDAVLNAGANGLVQFKTGGLNTTTGPAWLDGTPSKPEYVLNTDQTAAFIKLAEVLPQLLRAPSQQITKTSGDIYLDLVMNVDEIADDYDVDKIADRVKEIIYDSAEYRNVNVINFVR